MRETWNKFQKSPFGQFIRKHEKYLPVIFFMGGFVFDTMTLGRIDRVYDRTILSVHITSLTLVIYLFNLADDGKWKNTFLEKVQDYFPLMIQFFLELFLVRLLSTFLEVYRCQKPLHFL